MIEQGLQVLGLHIMWKTRNLPDAKDATPDDEKYIETLREQRDSLLEKLVEYTVGTQSNTAEAVKRAVRLVHLVFHSKYQDPAPFLGLPESYDVAHPLLRRADHHSRWACASDCCITP